MLDIFFHPQVDRALRAAEDVLSLCNHSTICNMPLGAVFLLQFFCSIFFCSISAHASTPSHYSFLTGVTFEFAALAELAYATQNGEMLDKIYKLLKATSQAHPGAPFTLFAGGRFDLLASMVALRLVVEGLEQPNCVLSEWVFSGL